MTRIPGPVVLAIAALSTVACDNSSGSSDPTPLQPVPVNTARATVADVAERLEAGGTVAAAQSAVISARLVAPVLEVRVRAGDRVKAGDVLVMLDARDVTDRARQASAATTAAEQALAQARTAQAAAEADYKLAEAWQARITALHARKSATEHERDEANARLASATARVAGSRAGIDLAEANVAAARAGAGVATATASFSILRAPFDAVVTERLTDPGNLAAPGTPLLRVESIGERRVEVTVDESRARFVQPGDRVEVLLDSASGAAPAASIDATVSEVARLVAADRRAFVVKITLPPGDTARTGSFARVRFRGASARTLLIPSSAVRRQGQVTSVFVVSDDRARLRLVQLGEAFDEAVAVLAGLEAGETIITAPPPELADNHPVAVQKGARP